jgi:hypothetical protein
MELIEREGRSETIETVFVIGGGQVQRTPHAGAAVCCLRTPAAQPAAVAWAAACMCCCCVTAH